MNSRNVAAGSRLIIGLALAVMASGLVMAQQEGPPYVPPGGEPQVPSESAGLAAAADVSRVQAQSSSVAQAQAEPAAAPAAGGAADAAQGLWPDDALSLVKTAGAVGLILCLIFAGFWAFRKFAPQYFGGRTGPKTLRLAETIMMGDKRSIALIELGDQRFLVGSTPNQISLLATVGGMQSVEPKARAGEPAELKSAPEAAGGRNGSFIDYIISEKNGGGARPAKAKAIPPDIRGKMRELKQALEG